MLSALAKPLSFAACCQQPANDKRAVSVVVPHMLHARHTAVLQTCSLPCAVHTSVRDSVICMFEKGVPTMI